MTPKIAQHESNDDALLLQTGFKMTHNSSTWHPRCRNMTPDGIRLICTHDDMQDSEENSTEYPDKPSAR
eukprot:6404423-Pyramimonas_sp.AAC.1